MSPRCFLFDLAMKRAHLAMVLGSLFPVSRLPLCYDATSHEVESAKAKKRAFVTIGRNEYTLWSQEVDHSPYWSTWSTNTATEFIRKYQHRYLYDTITFQDGGTLGPLYPRVITEVLYGPYVTVVLEGRKHEYQQKFHQTHEAISTLFKHHLEGPTHRIICALLELANRSASTVSSHVS